MTHFIWHFNWSKTFRYYINQIDGFVRTYDGTRYLVLSGPESYGATYNRISDFGVSMAAMLSCR